MGVIIIMSNVNKFKKQINVRLDNSLKKRLDREVRLRRTTQSQFIRDAIVKYLGIINEDNSDRSG